MSDIFTRKTILFAYKLVFSYIKTVYPAVFRIKQKNASPKEGINYTKLICC